MAIKDVLKDLKKNSQQLKKHSKEFQLEQRENKKKNKKMRPFNITGKKVEDLVLNSLGMGRKRKVEEIKTKVKEKQLIRAPNIIEWVINSEYMNSANSIEFTRCMQILHQMFELVCPKCDYKTWKNPDRIWSMKPIEIQNIHRFEYGICPKCGISKNELRKKKKLNDHYEMIGVAGMRSGKSMTTGGIIGTYQLHNALCYDSLPKFLGNMIERQKFTLTFIATSGKQAQGTVWEYFNNVFDTSPWFVEYVNYIKHLEKITPGYGAGDLFKRNASEVWFKNKNIYCDSANSNSGSLAGATRLLSVIDEFAKFDYASTSLRGADEVYRMMKKSLQTVRSLSNKKVLEGEDDPITGILATCSSPISQQDKLMQQYKLSKNHAKMFAFKYPTWEFNPNITKEDLAEEFENDYIGAMRDYGADPPGGKDPYLPNLDRIDSAQDELRGQIFDTHFYNRDVELQDGSVAKFIAAGISNCRFDKDNTYVIALDPGLCNHGFGISLMHMDEKEKNIFRVIVDGVIEILPKLDPRTGVIEREIDFLCIVPLIQALCKQLNVRCVTCDRWNSETMLQELQSKGIPVKKMNTSYTMYIDFRRDINTGNIRFPQAEVPRDQWDFKMRDHPIAKILLELMTLEDHDGKIKPTKDGSDDLIQTVVRGTNILRDIFSTKNFHGGPGLKKKKLDMSDRYFNLNSVGCTTLKPTISAKKNDQMMFQAGTIPDGMKVDAFIGAQNMLHKGVQNKIGQNKIISCSNNAGIASKLTHKQKKPKFRPTNQNNAQFRNQMENQKKIFGW